MVDNLKPVAPLTDVQAKQVAELQQKAAGIRKIIADAQTEFATAHIAYNTAMEKAKTENEPALNVARYKLEDVQNKMQYELTLIEEAMRDIRIIETAEVVK